MTEAQASLSPKSIVFWRHIVGIIILLLALSIEGTPIRSRPFYFFGYWIGTLMLAFGGAGVICGVSYLFFTSWLKGRVVRAFVICAWVLAGILIAGGILLPGLVSKLSTSKGAFVDMNEFRPTGNPTSPDLSIGLPISDRAEIDAKVKERAIAVQVDKLNYELPNWREIVGNKNDAKNRYRQWLSKQTPKYQEELGSTNSADVILSSIAKFNDDTASSNPKQPH